jgi:hypothetical protein
MTDYSKFLSSFWKEKDFSFPQKLTKTWSRFYPILLNATWGGIGNAYAGVKVYEYDKIGALNENAPTGESRHIRALSSRDDLVISIVAQCIINFNNYARRYVYH